MKDVVMILGAGALAWLIIEAVCYVRSDAPDCLLCNDSGYQHGFRCICCNSKGNE